MNEPVSETGAAESSRPAPVNKIAQVLLIAVMAFGSIFLWLGVPIIWLYIGSMVQTNSKQPGFGPYILIIFGIGISMVIIGRFLWKMNGIYGRITHAPTEVHVRMPWHRSMRGERDTGRPRTVLDVVMVTSVCIAGAAFLFWFIVFAGSSLPSA